MNISTFIGTTYPVDNDESNPMHQLSCELEETLMDIDEFIEQMEDFDKELTDALSNSTVTDVLVIRGW